MKQKTKITLAVFLFHLQKNIKNKITRDLIIYTSGHHLW